MQPENKLIYMSFLHVIVYSAKIIMEETSFIVKKIVSDAHEKREKGSIIGERKFKSLNGRWYFTKNKYIKDKPKVIESVFY